MRLNDISIVKSYAFFSLFKIKGIIEAKIIAKMIPATNFRPIVENTKANINQYQEVRDALKSLGFKVKEIDETLSTISIPNGTNEEILRAALRKMNKK